MRTNNQAVDSDDNWHSEQQPKHRLTRLVAAIAAAAAIVTGGLLIAEPAQAVSGTGTIDYGLGGINNDQDYFVGTVLVGGVDTFCISPGWNSPFGGSYTQGANTDFGWDPDKVARVNYVATSYHNTTDDDTAAAAQFAIWQLIAPFAWNMHGYSGSDFGAAVSYDLQQLGPLSGVGNFSSARISDVRSKAVSIYNDALGVHAGTATTTYVTGTPTTSTGHRDVDATIVQTGQTDHFTITIGTGIESSGSTGTLTLTNTTWDANGSTALTGTIHSGDVYPITADHAGSVTISVSGSTSTQIVTSSTTTSTTTQQMWLPLITALYNSDSSRQSLSYGAGEASYQVTVITTTQNTETRSYGLTASLTASIVFAPKLTTTVGAQYAAEGDRLIDTVTPVPFTGSAAWGKSTDGSSWLPVTFQAKVYRLAGPLADGDPLPTDAVLVDEESLTTTISADPTGVPVQAGGPVVDSSGFYLWVWSEAIGGQSTDTKPYLNQAVLPWTDDERTSETSIAPFQPTAVTAVTDRLVQPGDTMSDRLTVASANGLWLELGGQPIPVTFTGTAYQVAGDTPPVEGSGIPGSATALGTVTITANGPGVYTSPTVTSQGAGFVTWVWTAKVAAQPAAYRPYLAGDFVDDFGIHPESSSVRFPVSTTSEVREYNVHPDGRAFDTITVTGLPDDHGSFTGDGYWDADTATITNTVYGPLQESQLSDDLDLSRAPVLTSITIPAKNGSYNIGYTDQDEIRPEQSGYYVVVTSFAGDDRVQPYTSSPGDVLERFFVPPTTTPTPSVQVSTSATAQASVGDAFSDTATVSGEQIPDGSYLIFRAYGLFDQQPAVGQAGDPFYTSDKVPVHGSGTYQSGTTTLDRPGKVYWVETLYDATGTVLAAGSIGAPNEVTTVVPGPTPTPTVPPTSTPLPPNLAYTGTPDWVIPAGIIAALVCVLGGVLLFGRRLAKLREARGYVREEDLMSAEEFTALFDEPQGEPDPEEDQGK